MSRMPIGPLVAPAALLVFSVQIASPAEAEATDAQVYHEEVETHPSQGDVRTIDGAKAVLLTTENGGFANISTKELTPGNAYTMWFVAINAPEACETSPCKTPDVLERTKATQADVGYADGLIASDDGTGHFTAYVPVGELPHAWFGGGLQKPQSAEIHLVIADHGPLVPELAATMIGSYRGGCTDESVPAAVPDTARSDGKPGPNTCEMVQDVIFVQSEEKRAQAQ